MFEWKGLCARSIVVATGVQYRKLPIPRLEEFEGVGVYYAATEMELRFCRNSEAIVVGGGNSDGQAAMFLSRAASWSASVWNRIPDKLREDVVDFALEHEDPTPRELAVKYTDNLTAADVNHGRGAKSLKRREEIEKQTIRKRRLQHQAAAA